MPSAASSEQPGITPKAQPYGKPPPLALTARSPSPPTSALDRSLSAASSGMSGLRSAFGAALDKFQSEMGRVTKRSRGQIEPLNDEHERLWAIAEQRARATSPE